MGKKAKSKGAKPKAASQPTKPATTTLTTGLHRADGPMTTTEAAATTLTNGQPHADGSTMSETQKVLQDFFKDDEDKLACERIARKQRHQLTVAQRSYRRPAIPAPLGTPRRHPLVPALRQWRQNSPTTARERHRWLLLPFSARLSAREGTSHADLGGNAGASPATSSPAQLRPLQHRGLGQHRSPCSAHARPLRKPRTTS
ncbi:hypothetical protein MTO96_021787 [Rhipicephalus appendiculatus]